MRIVSIVGSILLGLLLLCFPFAYAEDRTWEISWDHDGLAADGTTPVTVDSFILAWDGDSGPPYANEVTIDGQERFYEMTLTGLLPGDTLYFTIKACEAGRCSAWAPEVIRTIVPDANVPSVTPAPPVNVRVYYGLAQ